MNYFIQIRFIAILFIFTVFDSYSQTSFIYGSSSNGGSYESGEIFRIDSVGGNFTTEYSFSKFDGKNPNSTLCKAANGKYYGVTSKGGTYNYGVLFEYEISTKKYTVKASFDGTNTGSTPNEGMVLAPNGKLYGMTSYGGTNNVGVIYEYNPSTNVLVKKHDFSTTDGKTPLGKLFVASDGNLYGMCEYGGTDNYGVIIKYNYQNDSLYVLKNFAGTSNGANPLGSFIQYGSDELYGLTSVGGSSNYGVLFSYNFVTDSLLKEFDFDLNSSGIYPHGSLVEYNGLMYGVANYGGSSSGGTLFSFNPLNDSVSIKINFGDTAFGKSPHGSPMLASNNKIYGMTSSGGAYNSGVIYEYNPVNNVFVKQLDLDFSMYGSNPLAGFVEDSATQTLIGTTNSGGVDYSGVLIQFDLTSQNATKVLFFNNGINGSSIVNNLLQATNGKIYGFATNGGKYGLGTMFEFNPNNKSFRKIVDFDGNNGSNPPSNLVEAPNGKIYGVVKGGTSNNGVIIEYDPTTDQFTKKIEFNGTNGKNPSGKIDIGSNGIIYGVTFNGGQGYGALYEYNYTSNQISKLYDFTFDGNYPQTGVIMASNGKLYGTTMQGGVGNNGVLFEYNLTSSTYSKINTPKNISVLMEAANGKIYGTSTYGGTNNYGFILEYDINAATYKMLNSFTGAANGYYPQGGLIEVSSNLYGCTEYGGTNSAGVIYRYNYNDSTYTITTNLDKTLGFGNSSQLSLMMSSSTLNAIYDTVYISACDSYYSPSGQLYTTSGLYSDTLMTASETDSIIVTNLTINSSPIVYFDTVSAVCENSNSILLSASPSGGSFSGNGVSANTFNPSTAGIGYHQINYTYVDINGCSANDSILINVNSTPVINISSSNSTFCESENSVSLAASPSGGSFSGAGVIGNFFNPSTAGIGTHQINYSYTDANGCSSSDSINFVVNANPVVAFDTSISKKACTQSQPITLSATPAGGTYSGTDNGSEFLVNKTPGFYNVSYSYTDANLCSATDSIEIEILAQPVATFSSALNSSYCEDADSVLMEATPAGGVFAGTGVVGNYFYPSSAQLGNNSMYYTYYDSNGCQATYSYIYMYIVANPNVQINSSLDSIYCENASNINLQATPAGGTFIGDGVSGNVFSPQLASIGNNVVKYTFTDSLGCISSDSISVIVKALPTINFTTVLNTEYCSSSTDISLNATPSGGSFSGSGVNGSIWSPSTVGSGSSEIVYTYTDADNCTNSDTISTLVNANPSIIFSPINSNYCEDAASISLVASPSGGSFTGAGVTGSAFSPATAGVGDHTINYSYTDANGCSSEDSISTIVNALPTVNFNSLADVCADASPINLSATPIGGTFSGQAVLNQGIFYPQISGAGTFNISYNYTDANGCSNTASTNIEVKGLPVSTFTIPSTACVNSNVNINFTGMAGSSASYNWNFDNATINTGSNAGPYDVTWTTDGLKQISLSVTDSGCMSTSTTNYINIISSFAMITAVGNTTACYGDSVTLFANTGPSNTYQWYNLNGMLANDTLSYISANQSGSYYCEVTPANGCVGNSDTIAVTVKPQLIADFTLAANSCYGDIVPISFIGTAPTGASYNWNFDSGIIASGSGSGPYNIIWNIDSLQTVGLTISEGNCISDLVEKNVDIILTPALVTALGNTSFCQGENVSLSANVGPYSYEWFKDGVSTSNTQAIYSANATGNYSVKVTDNNNNCSNISDSIEVIANTTNFNIAFAATPTSFTIPPFNTNFSNQTPNVNDYYWLWSFGDGNTSVFVNPAHQYQYDGNYSVGLIAQNIATGCYDTLTKTNYIQCTGGSTDPCNLDASIGHIGGSQICPSDSTKLFAKDHTAGINYQWLKDGILIVGATDSVYYAKQTGLYQLLLADGSCSEFSQPFAITQYTTVTPTILANGSIVPCTNDSMELYVSTSFNSYQWSNGSNAASVYVNNSGSYIVTVTDNNNCQSASQPYVVNASFLQVPDICIVGVDTATNHNRVVWERQNSAMIDSFRIYRESTVAGVYNLIGSQPFSTISVFEDVNSNPAQQAYRYRITAVDTCGMETAPSPIHKTLHLTINAGLGGVWNLIWTNYEGFNFGSYRIYRGTDSTNMTLLTQIQSNLTSYTDLNPPAGNVYYQIEIISPHPCYPDSIYTKANTNYNNSRSNTANTNMAPNTGFVQTVNNQLSMQLYPNPNKGNFIMEVYTSSNKAEDYQLEVYSTMGTLIHQEKLRFSSSLNKQMNFENLSKGVYFIRLINGNEVLNTRFIID